MTLDFEMPVMDGIATLKELQRIRHDVAVVMVSAHTQEGAAVTMQALELGAFDFIDKPDGASLEENNQALVRQLRPVIQSVVTKKLLAKTRGNLAQRKVPAPSRPVASPPSTHPSSPPRAGAVPPRPVASATSQPIAASPIGRPGRAEIIAIAISTGGPNALATLIPRLPANLRVPVVIVQHMPPVFTAALADSLDQKSALTVLEAQDGDVLKAGHVYIAPGGRQLCVQKRALGAAVKLTDDPPENHCCPAADYMMRSVAEVYGNKTIGVILTGMGSDGVKGLKAMKQRGSVVIAQDKESCVVYGMPMEAMKAGVADVQLPLLQIADELVRRLL